MPLTAYKGGEREICPPGWLAGLGWISMAFLAGESTSATGISALRAVMDRGS
jgi:hypothetical protein